MGVGEKETFTSIKENVGSYTAKNVSHSATVIDRQARGCLSPGNVFTCYYTAR